MYRIGFSKDIHKLVPERKLILAGVVFDYPYGELAHSDGDVVYHAVAESMLGALALGDLGKFFPDNSDETLNMDSSLIVSKVFEMVQKEGYEINNIDVFISLETPKLAPFLNEMKMNISRLLKTDIKNVSLKAGTNEKMGPVGKKEAVEAYSIVLLRKIKVE